MWCEKKNRRIHGTSGERPIDRLKKENLKPPSALDKYQNFLEEARKVHKDGFLSFDGVRYGVPWQYSGKEVVIRAKVVYLQLDGYGSNLFFQLISARYEKGSIILTSNKGFGEWGELIGDPVLATAVLDRPI